MKIRKGDKILVTAGKDKGKSGEVIKIFPQKAKAIVKGINIVKRHIKPAKNNPQGGIIDKESPISISNLIIICGKCMKPAKIAFQKNEKTGKKVRICKKCQEVI